MQIRPTNRLKEHLNRGIAESGNRFPLTIDLSFISLLRERGSHASHILSKLLKGWEVELMIGRLEQQVQSDTRKKHRTQTNHQYHIAKTEAGKEVNTLSVILLEVASFCRIETSDIEIEPIVNSGHFLLWVLSRPDLFCSRTLELYGVKSDNVLEYLKLLPLDEEYYTNIIALEQINRELERELTSPNIESKESIQSSFIYIDEPERGPHFEFNIEDYGVNLTQMALRGEIDPVIGRDREIERMIQILGRRSKNSPILVGEAGVGKSAIVEGLALRLAEEQRVASLSGMEIFSLDMAALVAGTKYRGEFEERIKRLLNRIIEMGNIILFVDEIHSIVGMGSSQGGLNAANILKPALARGAIQCIGATTFDEYRQYIEQDSALERRFQRIVVKPSTEEQTLEILQNIKHNYEAHHHVRYSNDALMACVQLTQRYIAERHLPDKAIDVMDEAGSRAQYFNTMEPVEMIKLRDSVVVLNREIEKAEVKQEPTDQLKIDKTQIEATIYSLLKQWRGGRSELPFTIEPEHIQQVITSITGIPIERVSLGEREQLNQMSQLLGSRVIGQSDATSKVVSSILRSRTGLRDPNKPIGVFMFVGPTGVGKTHLAKELSQLLYSDHKSLIRIDMSEYVERHDISRLIGSPPGYMGNRDGGQLTEAVLKQPYSVVLFDEIEKAHSDVFNLMLQVLDEGRLTDGMGREVSFKSTIIIMTSNIGSQSIVERGATVGYATNRAVKSREMDRAQEYREHLHRHFAPEFINRIDDIVVFNTLSAGDVRHILELELDSLRERTEALGYGLMVSGGAKERLATLGYDSKYGVRSLKRTLLERLEDPIAQLIVSNQLGVGDTIEVDMERDAIRVALKSA